MPDPFETADTWPGSSSTRPPLSTALASVRARTHVVAAEQHAAPQKKPAADLCLFPCPPASGDYVLTAQNGVMTWEAIGSC